MEKYNLRGQEGRVERLLEEIQSSPTRMYDIDSVKYNFDNCECPGCSCCDGPKFLIPIGVATLPLCTSILVAATAAEIAGK